MVTMHAHNSAGPLTYTIADKLKGAGLTVGLVFDDDEPESVDCETSDEAQTVMKVVAHAYAEEQGTS